MECSLVTPRVQSWIRSSRSARILHLFDEVINLVNENGEVLSISSMALGPGPFTMIMDKSFPIAIQHIGLLDPIKFSAANYSITLGALRIETAQAPVWEPRPQWSQLRQAVMVSDPATETLPANLDALLQRLLTAVHSNDVAAGRKATTSLAGLGNGLTPAGDDVLVGVLFALWVQAPGSIWIDLIAGWAIPLTTTLSAAFLSAAAAGEATIHWHNLVDGSPDAVDEIMSIGHSSGKDAWTGFVRGCTHPVR